ncbi:MAG: methyltransferase domain-containing protein [Actinomycetota bacterium]
MSDAEHWDGRWADADPPGDPEPWLVRAADRLPSSGQAVDLAGGQGRNALWLAGRGLDVTVVDVSAVGLSRAEATAEERGLALTTLRRDLPTEGPPPGPWDLAVIVRYLDRPLLAALPSVLADAGLVAFSQPTVVNLERHEHPREQFLLAEGEMASLVDAIDGLEVVELFEGWTPEGTHEAQLLARRR